MNTMLWVKEIDEYEFEVHHEILGLITTTASFYEACNVIIDWPISYFRNIKQPIHQLENDSDTIFLEDIVE